MLLTQENLKHMFNKNWTHMNVHSSIIHNTQKVKATQMPINWWMNKQNVVYPYNDYSAIRKELSTETCYNMDEPKEH